MSLSQTGREGLINLLKFVKYQKQSLEAIPKRSIFLLDRRQRDSIRSVLLVIIGWLVDWLVGNAVFLETALRIFLTFCMKLGDYKGRKVTEPDFSKKFLIWRYSQKGLQINPKLDTSIFFSKMAATIFFGFWPEVSTKNDLQFE